MHQMARSTVFISGMGGLGVEIGMYLSISYVQSVCIQC